MLPQQVMPAPVIFRHVTISTAHSTSKTAESEGKQDDSCHSNVFKFVYLFRLVKGAVYHLIVSLLPGEAICLTLKAPVKCWSIPTPNKVLLLVARRHVVGIVEASLQDIEHATIPLHLLKLRAEA